MRTTTGTLVVACILLALAFGLTGLGTWWLVDPRMPIWDEGPSRLLDVMGSPQTRFRPGPAIIERTYCLWTHGDGIVHRSLVNQLIFNLTDIRGAAQPGCGTRRIFIMIPAIPPGRYEFRVVHTFEVNPLKTIRYTWRPVPLEILP